MGNNQVGVDQDDSWTIPAVHLVGALGSHDLHLMSQATAFRFVGHNDEFLVQGVVFRAIYEAPVAPASLTPVDVEAT